VKRAGILADDDECKTYRDMISLTELICHMAAYPDAPPRTTALEQRIRIGSGFHNKWYRSQRDHLLGWMVVQACQARKKGLDPDKVDAKGMWGRLKCSPAMLWLAECAGVPGEILAKAEGEAIAAAANNPMDGDPHGQMMREVLPWTILEAAIVNGPRPAPLDEAMGTANDAFQRLTGKVHAYRHLREWAA
jgi:hypothetical protein